MAYQIKCLSLPSRPGIASDNDYRFYGNGTYAVSTARCHWIRLWVTWYDVDPSPVSSDLWTQWSAYANHVQFTSLDSIIADANANGVGVMLTMTHYYPTWANGATGSESGTGKLAPQRFPSNIDVGSPWERFVTYCFNRYRPYFDGTRWRGFVNGSGPNPSGYFGNPQAAWIGGLGIVNEPNYEHWQDYDPGCTAAKMMQTMDTAISYWNQFGSALGGTLFAPDLSDAGDTTKNGVKFSTSYDTTANGILNVLANWRPVMPWLWSHHNYNDIKDGTDARINAVHNRLINQNWRGGGDRQIWVSEGGWAMPDWTTASGNTQRDKVIGHFNNPHNSDYIMWTQHSVRDGGTLANPGGRTGVVEPDGTQVPLYNAFASLLPRRP